MLSRGFCSGFVLLTCVVALLSGCVTKKVRAQMVRHQKLMVRGSYGAQEVGLTLRRVHPALSECHRQAGSPAGRLVFQFKIRSEDGALLEPSILDDGDVIKHEGMRQCTIKVLTGFKFDKLIPDNDSNVIYPVRFPL